MDFDRLGYVDVGARGGASPHIESLGNRIKRVMIEPDRIEAERLKAHSNAGETYQVIDKALGHVDGPIEFNPAVNPFCSSVLRSNMEFLSEYNIQEHFVQTDTVLLDCARYDTEYKKAIFHYHTSSKLTCKASNIKSWKDLANSWNIPWRSA